MYWPAALLTAIVAGSVSSLSIQDETTVRGVCQTLISANLNRIGGFARLAFHDCVGGCNGCIDIGLTDSGNGDQPNAGLGAYINALEREFDSTAISNTGISRADFWALCGEEAVQEGRRQDNPTLSAVNINMRYGRVDNCSRNNRRPRSPKPENLVNFPNPRLGLAHVTYWCSTQFGLSERECVALLGAHTLGRTRTVNSGYKGPWTLGSGPIHLNNGYYIEMRMVDNWSQEDVASNPQTLGEQRWQYTDDQRPPIGPGGPVPPARIMMLNTDMCFVKDIQPNSDTGEVAETLNNVPSSLTASIVGEYADDNELWISEFGPVFQKMIETGYPEGTLTAAN